MAELADEKIMQRVKGGDVSELTELFERYHVKLYNFFLKLTFDKAASEDLTQNLFYRVIRYRHSFDRGNGSFKSWIYQIARNIHADYCKDQQKRTDRFRMTEDGEAFPGGHLSGHEGTYSEEQFERLESAMSGLSADQRELLVLSRYHGLKYEEISRIKQISVPAIKVQVHRAIKQLRSLYFKKS